MDGDEKQRWCGLKKKGGFTLWNEGKEKQNKIARQQRMERKNCGRGQ